MPITNSTIATGRGETGGRGLPRRAALMGLSVAAAGSVVGVRPARAAVPANLAFEVYRKGESIGSHRVRFTAARSGFVAATEIDLVVKVLGIAAYRFEQEVEDSWADDILVRCEARTNENGKKTEVRAERDGDRLKGEGPRGPIDQPLGMMTDVSWWNLAILRESRLLDAQNGGTNPLVVQPPVKETVDVEGRSVAVDRYALVMGSKHRGSNWYDASGRWVKTQLFTRNEELDYRLA